MTAQEHRRAAHAAQAAEDQQLLITVAWCIGQGLRDLQSTRKTPRLVGCRKMLIGTLRRQHGWTMRRCAERLGWQIARVKRISAAK